MEAVQIFGFQGMKDQVAHNHDFQEGYTGYHFRCIILIDQRCIGLKLQLLAYLSRHRKGLYQPDASILFSVFIVWICKTVSQQEKIIQQVFLRCFLENLYRILSRVLTVEQWIKIDSQ